MKNRFLALCLCLMLALSMLSACGASSSEDESTQETDASSGSADSSSDAEVSAEIPEEALEDVVYYLTDGLLSADDIVYTADGVDITAAYYFYWLTYEAYLYSQAYYNSYYVYPDITQEFSDGTTMADYVTTSAYNYMLSYVCAYAKASEAGLELSGSYLEEYESYYEESVYEAGEDLWDSAVYYGTVSEDDYTDEEKEEWIETQGEYQMLLYLMYYCTTRDGIDDLYYYNEYFSLYRDTLYLEGGEYELSDEDIEDYIEEYDLYACRYILFGNTSSSAEITDEEYEEYEALAQECADELSSLSGDDLDAAVLEYAESYTAGNACFSSSAEIIDGLLDALEDMEEGDVAVTAQTDYGYYVVVRDEVTRDTIITELEYSVEVSVAEAYYETLVSQWMEEAEVTDYGLLDDFDIYTFYENLTELREIIDSVS